MLLCCRVVVLSCCRVVVALVAFAIDLKKATESNRVALECRDLILASVVHACQDHSQRVRYYTTQSLFNVVKVVLRSLYMDVDVDVDVDVDCDADVKREEVHEELVVGILHSQITGDVACTNLERLHLNLD